MIVERKKDEIIVRLPSNVDLSELQNMIDYLKYKESTTKSKAKQSDADEFAKEANKSIWDEIKAQRNL